MAAILIRLIRSGSSYIEVPMPLQARQHGQSKAFKCTNIISVLNTLGELFWEVRITKRRKYAGAVRRIAPHA
ncbi:MAG: hypothetical protein FJ246_11005 [Nitrospira sp.]|nr:hypothetical protein [Nitrospira sp.]